MSDLVDIKNCSSGGLNPEIVPQEESFDIRDGVETKVRTENEGSKKIYFIDRIPYTAPSIVKSVTPNNAEVGSTVASVEYEFTILEGSEGIESIVSTPDVGAITANIQKTVTRTNVTSNTPGVKDIISIDVNDGEGVTNLQIGTNFQHRFFQGLSRLEDLNEAQIEALVDLQGQNGRLAESIIALYGGSKSYVIPSDGFQYYNHYLVPVGSQQITGAKLNDLPFPLTTLGNKTITNQHGLSIELVHKRSTNRFPGGTLNIDIS